ncbi:MAG: ABC-type transport auxiliary lipoprotein family protein [Pseudomonadota bacterium]
MIRLRCALASVAALAASQGCVSVLPDADPAAPRYGVSAIPADAFTSVSEESVDWSLSVGDPLSTRAIDTANIALVSGRAQYEYYPDGEWVDRAPRLVHSALVRSFENSGRIVAVGGRDSQPISDYLLQIDLRDFEADLRSGDLVARASIYARLTNIRGRIFAAQLFEAERPVRVDEAGAVAEALDAAAGELLPRIVDWALAAGEAAAETEGSESEARAAARAARRRR